MMKRLASLLALAAGAVLVLPATVQAQKSGGELIFPVPSEPPSYDGHREETFGLIHPIAPFYNTLLRVDPFDKGGTKPYPSLAESWTVSADGKTYTFKLRSGVKFHDGSTMTSKDVKASYDKIIFPPAGVGSSRKGQYAVVDAVEAPNANTVVFKLKYASGSFLASLLSDIGMLALDQVLGAAYGQVCASVASHAALCAAEQAAIGATHAEVGALLADVWKLPVMLAVPIANHHAPVAVTDAALRKLAELVYVAGRCADVYVDADAAPAIALTSPTSQLRSSVSADAWMTLRMPWRRWTCPASCASTARTSRSSDARVTSASVTMTSPDGRASAFAPRRSLLRKCSVCGRAWPSGHRSPANAAARASRRPSGSSLGASTLCSSDRSV